MRVICFDLDDTLFAEIDYLQSAYREIALFASKRQYASTFFQKNTADDGFKIMLRASINGENAFEQLNRAFGLDLPLKTYLNIYRNHKPQLQSDEKLISLLTLLRRSDNVLGLISDGRSVQQRNKIAALGIERFFVREDIIILEEFGSEKPDERNYRYFMYRYPDAKSFIYVGDNTQKDFITPNKLGWVTVGLSDRGRNIHKQKTDLPKEFLPQVWISNLQALSNFRIFNK